MSLAVSVVTPGRHRRWVRPRGGPRVVVDATTVTREAPCPDRDPSVGRARTVGRGGGDDRALMLRGHPHYLYPPERADSWDAGGRSSERSVGGPASTASW